MGPITEPNLILIIILLFFVSPLSLMLMLLCLTHRENCMIETFDGHILWQALSQSDGRWRYSSNNPESSTFAAGNEFSGII